MFATSAPAFGGQLVSAAHVLNGDTPDQFTAMNGDVLPFPPQMENIQPLEQFNTSQPPAVQLDGEAEGTLTNLQSVSTKDAYFNRYGLAPQQSVSQQSTSVFNETSKSLKRMHVDLPDENNASKRILYNVPVKNRYQGFQNMTEENSPNEREESEESIIKIPPFYVHKVLDYPLFISELKAITKNNFSTKLEKDTIKIKFNSIEDFREYRKFCEKEKIEHHTYRDPTQKTFSVVIKDLPITYSEEEIFNELSKNFGVLKVVRLFGRERKPLTTVAVDLTDNENNKAILKINQFIYSIVRVQIRIKSKTPIMCKNCQTFGHSQANCGRRPRCVRCLESHHYSQCDKPKHNNVPKCVNCSGEHTANYKGCKAYKEAVKQYNWNQVNQKFSAHKLPNRQFSNHQLNQNKQPYHYAPQEFPPLPLNSTPLPTFAYRTSQPPRPDNRNSPPVLQNMNIINENLIQTIINNILSAIIPQLQQMVQRLISVHINGTK